MARHVYKGFPPVAGTYPNNIRELALEKKMNIADLARVLNVAEATAYDICSGKRLPEFTNERKLEILFDKKIHEMYPQCYDGIKEKMYMELIPE